MIDSAKVDILIGLIQREKITLEDIKHGDYRAAVESKLEPNN